MFLDNGIYVDIQIGNLSGFLDVKDLISCSMLETSGLAIPTFSICFRTLNKKVKDLIIENNPITLKMGSDKSKVDTFNISILSKRIEQNTSESYICYIDGFLSDKKFIIDKMVRAVKGTSLVALKQLSSEYLNGFTTDISSVNETPQNWIISNQSNQQLMSDMWLHSNIYPSFPLICINRYGNLILKDFNKLKNSQPKYNFVRKTSLQNDNEIIYLNNLIAENNTHVYNLYAGYGKTVNIYDINTGNQQVYVNNTENNLSASQEVEVSKSGNRIFDGYYKSSNVHDQYHQTYFYNTSKLLQLSNICVCMEFKGIYKRDLNLLDLVNVGSNTPEKDINLTGRYVVNTIEYSFGLQRPFSTKVYVCRDSLNNLENNIVNKDNSVKIDVSKKQTTLENIKRINRLLANLMTVLSTKSYNSYSNYLSVLKYMTINNYVNLGNINLNNLSIDLTNLSGNQNFSYLLQSTFSSLGNTEINNILNSYGINNINGTTFNLNTILNTNLSLQSFNIKNLLNLGLGMYNSLISQTIPPDYQVYLQEILQLVSNTNTILTELSTLTATETNAQRGGNSMLETSTLTNQTLNTINSITADILTNTKGVDIPIPNIDITESQNYYSYTQLQDYVINQVIENLTNLGYLKNVDIDNFTNIMKGEAVLDYNTIKQINDNTGTVMYVRHWGSYKNLDDLTDFYIRSSYKDTFKSVVCTKTLDASGGKSIFVAIPSIKTNLTFYINSIETQMQSTEIYLKYLDTFGQDIPYTVYYTDQIFNSNSILLEVRES